MTTERIEEFWRDATAADVVRMMKGETVEARFHDVGENDWAEYCNELRGCKRFADGTVRWFSRDAHWNYCQVYDPPHYWLNKPEPGEGYRLLGKFPAEPVLAGDFIKDVDGAWMELVSPCNPVQGMTCWYRRRIEQPKPEPKHYTLQVGDTADVPSGHRIAVTEHGIEVQ